MLVVFVECKCLMPSHIYRGGLPSSRDFRKIYQLSRIYMCWKCKESSRVFTSSHVLELPRTFRNWDKLALLPLCWALGEQIGLPNLGGPQYYGDVFQALDKRSGEFVAVKKLKKKIFSLDESRNLKEVKCLRKMNSRPNIVKLMNLVKKHEDVFIVFEYMESDLLKLMKEGEGKNISEDEVRNLCFQVFQGLYYRHQQGYFHRDLKLSNLLVSKGVIKIGDLGMVKEIDSNLPCTDYVTTRWYRGPEVLLFSEIYGLKLISGRWVLLCSRC